MSAATANAAKLPAPTGNPWSLSRDDPATVPIPLPVIIVSVEGPYTERDRKLWTFLLHTVWEELDDHPIHTLSVPEINHVFREVGGDHNAQWIWESAERLADTKVKWIRTEGDKRYKGVGHLLSAEITDEAKGTGELRFSFPALLVPILKDPRRYARLRTHFMMQLSGKYAVTLYELLESVANKEEPALEVRVEELRRWLKVPEDKLPRWQDFRRRVLEPAIDQINSNPEGSGFSVHIKTIKENRAIAWLRFEVIKTKERKAIEAKLHEKERQRDLFEVYLKTDTYRKAQELAPGWDIYVLESEWRAWAHEKGIWPPEKPDAAFLGFCKYRGAYPGTRH